MPTVKFADLPSLEGQEIGVSDWLLIDQHRVDTFADATGDHQWIHVDVERAKATPFLGGTIAHGFLTLSLVPYLSAGMLTVEGVTHGINYGLDKVRFISMVHVGKRVRLRQKLVSATAKSGGWLIKSEMTMEIEGADKPAMISENLSMIFGA
jgi:acyl dehydratase